MRTQSQADVERICYQTELDRAEAYMNEHYGDPTAEECFEGCAHAGACVRMMERLSAYEPFEIKEYEKTGEIASMLSCDECDEYED